MRNSEIHIDGLRNHDRQEIVERRKDVAEGGRLTANFVRKVVLGKRVYRRRYDYDSDFILAIHKRVEHKSHEAGRLRTVGIEVNTDEAVKYTELPTKMYLFGRWLSHRMQEVNNEPDNIYLALETAAAAHWGLTSSELHPFHNGNGRTARALVNAILMHSTDEVRLHRIAILPVPILREGKRDRNSKYIRALKAIDESRILNPLMTFIANRWAENVSHVLAEIEGRATGRLNGTDSKLVETMKKRREKLLEFGSEGGKDNGSGGVGYETFPVPNYFDSVWMKNNPDG